MSRILLPNQNETFVPDRVAVEARAAADNVGTDTAATMIRREDLEAKAAALRTAGGLPTALYDLIDAMIAAGFDA